MQVRLIACQMHDVPVGALLACTSDEEKASYVVSLNIELHRRPREPHPNDAAFFESLLCVSPGLKNLKYLTLGVREDLLTPSNVERLNNILWYALR
jgi:hypothetical protein